MFKGVQKIIFRIRKISKFHTLALLDQSVPLLAILCDASMPLFHPYLKLHKRPIRM